MSTCQLIGKQPQQSKILLIIITVALPRGKPRWEHPESFSTINLTGFKCLPGRSVQGQAMLRTGQDLLANRKTHTTHFFLPLQFPFFLFTPLPHLSLRYLYPHFYLPLPSTLLSHLSPSSLHPSFFHPYSSLLPHHFSSLLHLSYLSPFSLLSQSSVPQRFFKLLLHFNGRFLFMLQVKQCN